MRLVERTLALLLAGSLAANSAGPACLVLACPMGVPCEQMAASELEACCEDPALSAPLSTCCDGGGLTAALRKPASGETALATEPAFAGLAPERPAKGRASAPTEVPPAPPPDGGLYTLHATFLI